MATAAFIEESHAHRRGLLGVSKSSARIGKLKRGSTPAAAAAAAATTSGSNQRPPPTVYKIEPEGFRSLVQELTGPNSSIIHQRQPQQIQEQQPLQAKISNRLQSLAPAPIAPFKPSFYTPGSISPKFDLPANSPKFAFPPLNFSPLADLTPRDSVWASGLESPELKSVQSFSSLIAGGVDEQSKVERTGSFAFSPKFFQGSSTLPGGFGFSGVDFNFSNL